MPQPAVAAVPAPGSPRSVRELDRYARASAVLAVVVILAGVLAWIGWGTGIEGLERIVPTWPAMTPWTAILAGLLAGAVLLRVFLAESRGGRASGLVLATAVGLASIIFLAEYVTGASLGLDTWWFGDAVSELMETYPGRPSPQTAGTFALLSVFVGSLVVRSRLCEQLGVLSLFAGSVLASFALLGYMFDATGLFAFTQSTGMSVNTAVSALLVALAALLADAERPPLSWLLRVPKRVALERLIVTVLGFPLLVWLGRTILLDLGLSEETAWAASIGLGTLVLAGVIAALSVAQDRARALLLATSAELAVSEGRYRLMAQNAADIVVSATNEGAIDWISDSVEVVLGHSPDELLGRRVSELVHPDDQGILAENQRSLESGMRATFIVRMRTSRGDWRWIEIRGKARFDDAGAVIGRMGSWTDVDDRVRAEALLARSQEILASALDSELDGHVILSAVRDNQQRIADLRIEAINAAACIRFDRPREEVVGRGLIELRPELTDTDQYRAYVEVVETGVPLVLDDQPGDGFWTSSERFLDVRGVRVLDGISVVFRDVTERVDAGTQLAESEERYRLLAENATDVVYRTDASGVLTWISAGLGPLLGWEATDVLGRPLASLVHPEDRLWLIDAFPATGTKAERTVRVRMIAKSGPVRWVELTAHPVRPGGPVDGYVGGWRDVTAEQAAVEQVAESERRFRFLADNATDAVLAIDAARNITWASSSIKDSLGWSPDVMVGSPFLELIHPDDRPTVEGAIELSFSGHALLRTEFGLVVRFASAAGRFRHVALRMAGMADAGHHVVEAVVSTTIVDDLVEAQKTAHEQAAILRAVRDAAVDPQLLLEAHRGTLTGGVVDFTILDANPPAAEFLDLGEVASPTPILGALLGGKAALAPWIEALAPALKANRPVSIDGLELPAKEGQSVILDMRCRALSGDRLSVSWRDVTEKRNLLSALEEREAHYRLLAEHTSDVVLRVGRDGLISWASPSALRSMGWQPQDLVGQRNADLIHPDQREEFVEAARSKARSGEEASFTILVRQGDGEYRWMESAASVVPATDDGPPERVVRLRLLAAEADTVPTAPVFR